MKIDFSPSVKTPFETPRNSHVMESQLSGDDAPGEILSTPSVPTFDAHESFMAYFQSMVETGKSFARFAEVFSTRLDEIGVKRPYLADAKFDVVVEKGRLKIVDTELWGDVQWIEDQLNADPDLARLAVEFNQQVVKAYDTQSGGRDEQGALIGHGKFGIQGNGSIDYAGLETTIDESVKLRSLLKEARAAEVDYDLSMRIDPDSHPPTYSDAGLLVQKYLRGAITSYGGDGTVGRTTGTSHFTMRFRA